MKPSFKINVKKSVNLFVAIFMTVRISDYNVESIDLMVKQNVLPVNNPVDYDYIGQTLHLKPFDLKAEFETANATKVPTPKMDRKILYSLNENQLSKPLTEIPYYRQGKSAILPESVFKQYNEGHQPWLSSPVIVALVNCSNLISLDDVAELQNKAQSSEKKIIIDSDRVITEVSSEAPYVKVQMSKPGGITYDITMFKPQGTEVLFVKEIVENTPIK